MAVCRMDRKNVQTELCSSCRCTKNVNQTKLSSDSGYFISSVIFVLFLLTLLTLTYTFEEKPRYHHMASCLTVPCNFLNKKVSFDQFSIMHMYHAHGILTSKKTTVIQFRCNFLTCTIFRHPTSTNTPFTVCSLGCAVQTK